MEEASIHKQQAARYWIKIFAWYALTEACIQLLFIIILNNFGSRRISIPEFHLVMWFFQCVLIIPIWWVAWLVSRKRIWVQVIVQILFYIVYSIAWFGPVQQAIAYIYDGLQHLTRTASDRQVPALDDGSNYSYLNYQLLKHAFRLSWFYLAAYFFNYHLEEQKKTRLAIANKELQLKLLKWRLNPSFYFKTIGHLKKLSVVQPSGAAAPILQLAKVMEYVIYDAREPQVEMKREIQFLSSYTALISRQDDHRSIEMDVGDGYEKFRIAPLLLAGIVDNILEIHRNSNSSACKMTIRFSDNRLELVVTGLPAKPVEPPLLGEMYKGRFNSAFLPGKEYKLNIQLEAA